MSAFDIYSHPTDVQERAREAATRQRAQEQARQREADARALAEARTRAEAGSVEGKRTVVALLARLHNITIETRRASQMPAGVAAYANPARRQIVIPPVVDDESFAVALHEIGHCVSEPCAGHGHQRHAAVKDWWQCVRCEALAWEAAMRLVTFNRGMFTRLQVSLHRYLRHTPAAARVIADTRRLASDRTYATVRQARLEHELRLELHADLTRELATRPRRTHTKLEQQLADYHRWCREDARSNR